MDFKKDIEILLEDLKNQKIDRRRIEKDLGYGEFYIDQLLSRGGNLRFLKVLERYAETLQKSINEIQEPVESYTQVRRNHKNDTARKKTIPFYDAEAIAGAGQTDMTPISAPAGTIDIGDLLHDSESALRIYGNSMIPNYPPGCVVGLVKVAGSFIQPGEVYVIETSDQRLVKRLFYKNDDPESDKLTCYSDNIMTFEGGARDGKLAYPPFDLPKDEINKIFLVTGVIKRNTNSIIIHRN